MASLGAYLSTETPDSRLEWGIHSSKPTTTRHPLTTPELNPRMPTPGIHKIQEELGLQRNYKLLNKIRETGTTLLKAADILLLPATGKEVQLKKREVANHLEQLFPKVFGATPGSNRDFELQRTTSYAILTTAMDKAKRKPIDKTKTHGKRRAELAPSPPRAKRVMYTTAVKPVQDPSLSMPKPEIRTATEPSAASAAGNDLVVIFTTISDGIAVYSPMSWAEMIPSGDELPSLKQVHVNLMEDGLDIKWNQYTLYDPEGIPVRSDKCLNYLLGCCLKKGVVEVEWMVVVDIRQWGSQEDA